MRVAMRGLELHSKTFRNGFGIQSFRNFPFRKFVKTRSVSSKRDPFYSETAFSDFALSPILSTGLTTAGFHRPSQIQGLGIDSILEGKDVLLAAETGSGKTLAYLLPILTKLLEEKPKPRTPDEITTKKSSNFALVLCPSVDLCRQVQCVLKSLCNEQDESEDEALILSEISPAGFSRYKRRPDVLLGTPGSVLSALSDMGKHIANRILTRVSYVIIDEADLMLTGSYRPQIDRLLQMMKFGERELAMSYLCSQLDLEKASFLALPRHIKKAAFENGVQGMIESGYEVHDGFQIDVDFSAFWKKQFVLVGATIPSLGTKNIRDEIQELFPRVQIITTNNLHKMANELEFDWIEISEEDRLEALLDTIMKDPSFEDRKKGKILIFAKDSMTTELISSYLVDHGVNCVSYHKKLNARDRSLNLDRFRSEQGGLVMVSTDGMSRGMDIVDITHVIQCNFASSAISFLHRVGRTCRAMRSGKVTSFVTQIDKDLVEAIRECLEQGTPIEGAFSRNRSFRKKFRRYGKFIPRGKGPPNPDGIQERPGCTELECPI